jgi:hypothetical protein
VKRKTPRRKTFRITFEVSDEGEIDLPPSGIKMLSAEEIANRGGDAGIDAILAGFEADVRDETGRVDIEIVFAALAFAAHRLKAPWLADHLLSILKRLAMPVMAKPDFIRWCLVGGAKRDGVTWDEAFNRASEASGWSDGASASEKAKWSDVAGSPGTMAKAYKQINRQRREEHERSRRRRVG